MADAPIGRAPWKKLPGMFTTRLPRTLLFMWLKKAATTAAGAVLVGWAECTGIAGAAPPPPQPPPPPPAPTTTIDHDGTYSVGTDIVPGTYTSAGPVQGGVCYWKRTNGSDIVDNAMSKQPQVVQIDPTDKAFKTDGCQPWQKNDAATVDPGKPPADVKMRLDILNGLLNQHGGQQPSKP